MKTSALVLVAAATLFFSGANVAEACDCKVCKCPHHYKKVVTEKEVVEYVTKKVQYIVYDTVCDECGRTHKVARVCYRDVKTPVTRVVKVVRYVAVCACDD